MGTEVRVCSTVDVPAPSSRRFDLEGHRLCVVHLEGDWYVIGDRCSHADASLSEGDLWVDECEIECPKHGSTFDLRTGEALALPATKPVPVYDVRLEGDDVMVTLP
jgi:3-phenylpropionate/trans-cinnamate dioxygenase ferredoxin component